MPPKGEGRSLFWKFVIRGLGVLCILAFWVWWDAKESYSTPNGDVCSRFLFVTNCRDPDDPEELVFLRTRARAAECAQNARLLASWDAEIIRHRMEVELARSNLGLVSRDDYQVQLSEQQRREGVTAEAARANLITEWRAALGRGEFCWWYAVWRAGGRTGDEAIRNIERRVRWP